MIRFLKAELGEQRLQSTKHLKERVIHDGTSFSALFLSQGLGSLRRERRKDTQPQADGPLGGGVSSGRQWL